MSAAEKDSVRLLVWMRIIKEGEGMIAAFEADHMGTPPVTLVEPLEDRTRAAWVALWQDIAALIAVFEKEYGGPTQDDRRLATRQADKADVHFAKLRCALEQKHPGLDAIANDLYPDSAWPSDRPRTEVDVLETLFAHAVDGFDLNDELNAMEEDALIQSGLSREEFMAARSRLRGYVDRLPEEDRRQAVAAINAARRRRN